jgi:hypothetical protein
MWHRFSLKALFVALLAFGGPAAAQMMPSPIWIDAERVAVFCFVEPDPALAIAAFQTALCGRSAELLRTRVGNVLPVTQIGIADAAATFAPGTVVALIHARAQRADQVVPGANGMLVSISARLMRNHSMLHSASFFGASPATAAVATLDQTDGLDAMLARLIGDLLARG